MVGHLGLIRTRKAIVGFEECTQALVHCRLLQLEQQDRCCKQIVAREGDVSLVVHGID